MKQFIVFVVIQILCRQDKSVPCFVAQFSAADSFACYDIANIICNLQTECGGCLRNQALAIDDTLNHTIRHFVVDGMVLYTLSGGGNGIIRAIFSERNIFTDYGPFVEYFLSDKIK